MTTQITHTSAARVAAQKAAGYHGQFGELAKASNAGVELEMPTAAGYLHSAAAHVEELLDGHDLANLGNDDLEQWGHHASDNAATQAAAMAEVAERINVKTNIDLLYSAKDTWLELADTLTTCGAEDEQAESDYLDAAMNARKAAHSITEFLDVHGPQKPLVPKPRPTFVPVYPRLDTLRALADDPDSVTAVFGSMREPAARQLRWIVESITPTAADRATAALTNDTAWQRRIRAYDNGRRKLAELYFEHSGEPLPDSVN